MFGSLFEKKFEDENIISSNNEMIIHKEFLFPITLFQIEMRNWEEKRVKLMSIYENNQHQFERDSKDLIHSDWGNRDNDDEMSKLVGKIFSDEIHYLRTDFPGCEELYLKLAWFQNYIKGSTHYIHNHGNLGYSGICYIKYNQEVHNPAIFVGSYNHPLHNYLIEYKPSNIKEGTMLIFPSFVNHYVPVNHSDEERIILSFNLRLPNQP